MLNDYFDALSGSDAVNRRRLFPFSGGSRFIQNGMLGVKETGRLATALLAARALLRGRLMAGHPSHVGHPAGVCLLLVVDVLSPLGK